MAHIFSMQFQHGNEHYYCWVVPNVKKSEYSVLVTNDVFSEYSFDKYLFTVENYQIVNQQVADEDSLHSIVRLALQEHITRESEKISADKAPIERHDHHLP